MKSARSSGKPRRPRIIVVRRIKGHSMHPNLVESQIILASRLVRPKVGKVVVIYHDGLEKIKRITAIKNDGRFYVLGDNPLQSKDSREFGYLNKSNYLATVIWPKS